MSCKICQGKGIYLKKGEPDYCLCEDGRELFREHSTEVKFDTSEENTEEWESLEIVPVHRMKDEKRKAEPVAENEIEAGFNRGMRKVDGVLSFLEGFGEDE